jgi:hypothetical protein
MSTVVKEATESAFAAEKNDAYLANITTKGFKIVLPKVLSVAATYNWTAVSVKEPKHTVAESVINNLIEQLSIPEVIPTPAASNAVSPTPEATPTAVITPEASASALLQ